MTGPRAYAVTASDAARGLPLWRHERDSVHTARPCRTDCHAHHYQHCGQCAAPIYLVTRKDG